MKNKTAKHTTHLFGIYWHCQYPQIYNNGSEFIGFEFKELNKSYGIGPRPITVKNPQVNSVKTPMDAFDETVDNCSFRSWPDCWSMITSSQDSCVFLY